jgi:hypothetical protein
MCTVGSVFERFTDRSRRVLVLAQEEARLLDHTFIGTEHFLLGLIHEGDGIAAAALGSLGITLDAVRADVASRLGEGHYPPGGAPPFTPRAKKVLELSLREALQLGHSFIGTEHLLLGLVREGEGFGCQVLVGLGADLIVVRQRVIELMGMPEGHMKETVPSWPPTPVLAYGSSGVEPKGPRCPRCHIEVADGARYRRIDVAAGDGDGDPLAMLVVYCDRCGSVLDVAKDDGSTGA